MPKEIRKQISTELHDMCRAVFFYRKDTYLDNKKYFAVLYNIFSLT